MSSRISAVFGTHSTNCHISELIWRLGPSCLLEDPLADEAVSIMYKLGPSYNGCFQSPVVSEYYEVRSSVLALIFGHGFISQYRIYYTVKSQMGKITQFSHIC